MDARRQHDERFRHIECLQSRAESRIRGGGTVVGRGNPPHRKREDQLKADEFDLTTPKTLIPRNEKDKSTTSFRE